jgi:hypothetical protein
MPVKPLEVYQPDRFSYLCAFDLVLMIFAHSGLTSWDGVEEKAKPPGNI